MFGLFIFTVLFVAICLLISNPKQSMNLEPAKALPQQNNNSTQERRHNTTEPIAEQGVFFFPGFQPLGLLPDRSSIKADGDDQIVAGKQLNPAIIVEPDYLDDKPPEYVRRPLDQEEKRKPPANNFNTSTSSNYSSESFGEDAAYATGGAVLGAGVAATVGGMGLAVGGTAVGIGAAPIVAAGTVAGLAVSGAKKAIDEGDATALGAIAGGAAIGAGVSTVVGGMGLAVGGTAVAIGMAPVAAVGAVVGLASYGLWKLMGGQK